MSVARTPPRRAGVKARWTVPCKFDFRCLFDTTQGIAKRHRGQDEVGTRRWVTIDVDTLVDNAVAARDKDATDQVRTG
ncbi:MAG: hypothetical protein M1134_03470 [Actinobacteria bacterium]|jgi:glycyl-tRNA synthetase (class II)|nr:hypothetical protein [Actinomycetota bacterium]MCL5444834.1 hypothetical protein [Actinomycetota bacterium]